MDSMFLGIGNLAFLWQLAPLITLIVFAALAIIFAAFARGRAWRLEFFMALAGLVATILVTWRLWPLSAGISVLSFASDRIAMAGIMIVCVSAIFSILVSPSYLEARNEMRPGFYALVLLAVFGMAALISANDLVTLIIALECMALSVYALAGFLRERPASLEGALKYFITGAFASAFICMGIAFIFGGTGTTDLLIISERAASAVTDARHIFLFGVAMLAAGLAFKVAAAPFHAWAPDAYDGAPTPITLLMATGVKAAALMAFLRVALAIAPASGALWHNLMWGLSALTILWGNLAALRQQNIKRMLAYSCIAHAGYMLMVFPSIAVNPIAMSRALLFYIIAYTLMTAGAFAAISAIGLAHGEPGDLGQFTGLAKKRPAIAAALSIFLISLAGFPPLLGFFGKYYLFMATVKAGDVVLSIIAVAGSVISAYYYLRPIMAMYFHEAKPATAIPAAITSHAFYTALVSVLVITVLAVAIFGILPQDLLAFVEASAH